MKSIAKHLCYLLAVCSAGCDERVSLSSSDGSDILTYQCSQFQSRVGSPADEAVIHQHFLRIIGQVAERGDNDMLERLSEAYESDRPRFLEEMVVNYVCENGIVQKSVPVFPEPGSAALDFDLKQLMLEAPYESGPSVRLLDHRGSVVVLNVFGTWCPPCLEKYPGTARVAHEYHDRGVRFFGILLNDSPRRAAKWFRENGGLAYPFLLEKGSSVEADWELHGAPRMFVIDQQGIIADRCIGCTVGTLSNDSLPVLLDSLLASQDRPLETPTT